MGKGNFKRISSRSRFDQLLSSGKVLASYVCYIEDTGEIWMQGKFLIPEAPNDGEMYARQGRTWVVLDKPELIGAWSTGVMVPKMGIVTMGGMAFMAKVDTMNPPLFVYTDKDANRLVYSDGG
jgi:hypothetical protein